MKIDLKAQAGTILTVIGFVCTLVGFYYTTQHRLDALEADVIELREELAKTKKAARRANKRGK